jgi:hypothetical protein
MLDAATQNAGCSNANRPLAMVIVVVALVTALLVVVLVLR